MGWTPERTRLVIVRGFFCAGASLASVSVVLLNTRLLRNVKGDRKVANPVALRSKTPPETRKVAMEANFIVYLVVVAQSLLVQRQVELPTTLSELMQIFLLCTSYQDD